MVVYEKYFDHARDCARSNDKIEPLFKYHVLKDDVEENNFNEPLRAQQR